MKPVLESPWALEEWFESMSDSDPEAFEEAVGLLRNWIKRAMLIVSEDSKSPEDDSVEPKLISKTIARLYWKQGHRKKALEIYEALMNESPDDEELRAEYNERLQALHERPYNIEKIIEILEQWLVRIRLRRQQLRSAGMLSDG